MKIHAHKCRFKPSTQQFAGTCADKKVKQQKVAAAQKLKPQVLCEGAPLENVMTFKYLGSVFAADGEHHHDVVQRTAMAMARCGELRQVFSSSHLKLGLKLKIYKVAVTSLMTYGSEAWNLTPQTQAKINGANARCLSRITGNSAHVEASRLTRTYDLVRAIRQRRMKWLGHILRLPGVRLVKIAIKVQHDMGIPGNMLMDAPNGLSFSALTALANDRQAWKGLCGAGLQ